MELLFTRSINVIRAIIVTIFFPDISDRCPDGSAICVYIFRFSTMKNKTKQDTWPQFYRVASPSAPLPAAHGFVRYYAVKTARGYIIQPAARPYLRIISRNIHIIYNIYV